MPIAEVGLSLRGIDGRGRGGGRGVHATARLLLPSEGWHCGAAQTGGVAESAEVVGVSPYGVHELLVGIWGKRSASASFAAGER